MGCYFLADYIGFHLQELVDRQLPGCYFLADYIGFHLNLHNILICKD